MNKKARVHETRDKKHAISRRTDLEQTASRSDCGQFFLHCIIIFLVASFISHLHAHSYCNKKQISKLAYYHYFRVVSEAGLLPRADEHVEEWWERMRRCVLSRRGSYVRVRNVRITARGWTNDVRVSNVTVTTRGGGRTNGRGQGVLCCGIRYESCSQIVTSRSISIIVCIGVE